jgi:hypothetical protein
MAVIFLSHSFFIFADKSYELRSKTSSVFVDMEAKGESDDKILLGAPR